LNAPGRLLQKSRARLCFCAEKRAGTYFAQADWYDSVSQEIFARKYCEKILKDQELSRTAFASAAKELLAMMDRRMGNKEYKPTFRIVTTIKAPEDLRPLEQPHHVASSNEPKILTSDISSSKADLGRANQLFKKGLGFYGQGMRVMGTRAAKGFLTKALSCFEKAGKIYNASFERDPKNSKLESRVVDCGRFRYACFKHITL